MKLDKKGLQAIANLVVHFNIHLIKKLWPLREKGLEKFLENYQEDYILALSSNQREDLSSYGKCINCGLCLAQCPVLSHITKDNFWGPRNIAISLSRSFPELWAGKDLIFNCLFCSSCEVVCPQGVPISKITSFIRSFIYKENYNFLPSTVQEVINALNQTGNIFGQRPKLPKQKEKAEYLVFAGCWAINNQEYIQNIVNLFQLLKVDWTFGDEVCCGRFFDLLDRQEEKERLISHNLKMIKEKSCKKLITLCPGCYYFMKNEPLYNSLEIENVIQFLTDKSFEREFKEKVTYHDPCDLGRLSGIYEEPRTVIKKLFPNFKEMPNNREFAHCCGARGSFPLADKDISETKTLRRLKEAESTGAEILLTECPSCVLNFRKVAEKNPDLKIKVYNISEFLGKFMQ